MLKMMGMGDGDVKSTMQSNDNLMEICVFGEAADRYSRDTQKAFGSQDTQYKGVAP